LAPPSGDYSNQQLFNPEDAQFFFNDFLGNLDENDNFMFNPSLPLNMPIYPNPSSDNNDPSSSHHLNSPSIVDNVYILPGQTSSSSPTSDLLNRNQYPPTNSTSLSPRTSNITLSPPPSNNHLNNNHNNDDDDDDDDDDVVDVVVDDVSTVGGKVDRSSTPTVPSKRKKDNDDDRSGRRSSNPRLSPINTKLSMTQSNSNNNTSNSNNNNGSRPLTPPMLSPPMLSPPMLSTLSINNNNNNNNSNNNNNTNNNNVINNIFLGKNKKRKQFKCEVFPDSYEN